MNRFSKNEFICYIYIALILFCTLPQCGSVKEAITGKQEEESEDQTETPTGSTTQILPSYSGWISSPFGKASALAGWKIALLEIASGKSHLTEVTTEGTYSFQQVSLTPPFSLMLLNKDFQLSSVLGFPNEQAGSLQQYFTPEKTELPFLIYKGGIIRFENTESLTVDPTLIADINQNALPDGVESLWNDTTATELSDAASPFKGDVDADGLPNVIDPDDDGDGILDAMDTDSNGNDILDHLETTHDQFFESGLDFITFSIEKKPDQSTFSHHLKIIAKTKPESQIGVVTLKGPDSIFLGAKSIFLDDNGTSQNEEWEGNLIDDGTHFDVRSQDGIFGVNLLLTNGLLPNRNQVFFIELETTQGTIQRYSYPQTFPEIELGTISSSIEQNVITRAGEPFPAETPFNWQVLFFDSQGQFLFMTEEISNETTTTKIPSQIFKLEPKAQYKLVATSGLRMPFFSTFIVHGELSNIP